MVKKILFVFDDRDINNFLEKNKIEDDVLVICNENKIKEIISKKGLNGKLITEYLLSNDQKIESMRWIKDWSNKKILNGKNIKEFF